MGRPARLCKLAKGKLIDAQDGFVETFNWMVDYINNLRGDEDKIKLTNPTGTNPVIRLQKTTDNPGGESSFDVRCVDSEGNETTTTVEGELVLMAGADTNVVFTADDGGVVKLDVYYK